MNVKICALNKETYFSEKKQCTVQHFVLHTAFSWIFLLRKGAHPKLNILSITYKLRGTLRKHFFWVGGNLPVQVGLFSHAKLWPVLHKNFISCARGYSIYTLVRTIYLLEILYARHYNPLLITNGGCYGSIPGLRTYINCL